MTLAIKGLAMWGMAASADHAYYESILAAIVVPLVISISFHLCVELSDCHCYPYDHYFNLYRRSCPRSTRMPCISHMCGDMSFYCKRGIVYISWCCPAFILCLRIEPAFFHIELVLLDAVPSCATAIFSLISTPLLIYFRFSVPSKFCMIRCFGGFEYHFLLDAPMVVLVQYQLLQETTYQVTLFERKMCS